MNAKAAQTKACRLWGPKAHVRRSKCGRNGTHRGVSGPCTCTAFGAHLQPCPTGIDMFEVGELEGVAGITFYVVKGTGGTWESAFGQFEARERKDREEYEARKATNGKTAQALNQKLSAAFFGKGSR